MSERPYLSIGEVLGLLLEEFPDVTISKIRFLEAQGLIDPERTSSGYRKFYDNDVERLRFILREQKDNYLPLKVIKDRLDSIDHTLPNPPRPIPSGASWLTAPGDEESVVVAGPAGEARTSMATAQSTSREWSPQTSDSSSSRPSEPVGEFTGINALFRSSVPDREIDVVTPPAVVEAPKTVEPPPQPEGLAGASAEVEAQRSAEVETPPVARRPPTAEVPSPAPREPRMSPIVEPAPPALAVVPPLDPTGEVPAAVLDGAGEVHVELTADELCAQASITAPLLKDLESYGLVVSRLVSGLSIYGLDALRIAKAAGQLAEHGLEPRHLRSWRTSVDREIALIEQLVQPLLRQRNPQSRAQAARRADEISRLGGELRNALVRMEIHALIEP